MKRGRAADTKVVDLTALEEPEPQGRTHRAVLKAEQLRRKLSEVCVEGVERFRLNPLDLALKWKKADAKLLAAALGNMAPTLRSLDLSPNGCNQSFTADALEAVPSMTRLTALVLRECPLSVAAVDGLSRLMQLEELVLGGIAVGLGAPLEAQRLRLACPRLTRLCVESTNISDEAVAFLAQHAPLLAVVSLASSPHLSGVGVAALAASCTRMDDLNLLNCAQVTRVACLESCRASMTALNLQRVPFDSLPVLPKCETLQLSCCSLRESDYVTLKSFAALRSLDLNGTKGLLGGLLASVFAALPKLEFVSLNGSRMPDVGKALAALSWHCKHLKALDLNNSVVPEADLKSFAKALPDCDVSKIHLEFV
jgi:hypothetical protein